MKLLTETVKQTVLNEERPTLPLAPSLGPTVALTLYPGPLLGSPRGGGVAKDTRRHSAPTQRGSATRDRRSGSNPVTGDTALE